LSYGLAGGRQRDEAGSACSCFEHLACAVATVVAWKVTVVDDLEPLEPPKEARPKPSNASRISRSAMT